MLRPATRRLAPWVTIAALALLAGGAATASALSATPGGGLVHVSVPRGWKPVTYGGLTIDVPGWWTIEERADTICLGTGPVALVGPPFTGSAHSCLGHPQVNPIVVFGGPDTVTPVGHERSNIINGVELLV